MANADYVFDNEKLRKYVQDALIYKESIENVCADLLSLVKNMKETSDWIGNGKEVCTAYLSLVGKYAHLIAGAPDFEFESVISNSIMDNKSAEGTDQRHLEDIIQAVEELIPDIDRVSKNSADKAECIIELDTVMGT